MAKEKTTDALAKASKVVNRALRTLHSVGNLKELKSEHISKIETAISNQIKKSIDKLRTPAGAKDEGFKL